MGDYQINRIRCCEETARQLITSPGDGYLETMDFRKAFSLKPEDKKYRDAAKEPVVRRTEDGRYDFGFGTEGFAGQETAREFTARYPDAEWWILQDGMEIYHYYCEDGEVTEDVRRLADGEREQMEEKAERWFLIFTEKEDQSRYVNIRPDKQSAEYTAYRELVRKIAGEIAGENTFYALKDYGRQWEGAERVYGLPCAIRIRYLYGREEELSGCKMNVLSRDVAEELRRTVFPYNKKLYDAVFGLVIGDALGVPYEFKRRGTFECTGMTGYGSHYQPAGTWSDDTSLMLATLKSLKDRHGKVDTEDIRKNFLRWYNDREFTADGTLFDVGITTSRALESGRPCCGENDNGNGSLMRILPLAFTDCTDDEIRAVSAITHGHWISQEACVIYVHVARRLLAGEDILDILPTLEYGRPFDRLRRIQELDRAEIRSSG